MDTERFQQAAERYKDTIFRIALNYCKNCTDADDITQNVLIRCYKSNKAFDSEEHLRNWLIRVAINKAKNTNRTFWKKNRTSLEEYMETLAFETPESEELFGAVMNLPGKYRIVIHLFYYEDYAIREIAGILNISENNVKVRLSRGRLLLKEKLKEEWENDK